VGALVRWAFCIAEAETTFARRGFRGGENGARTRIERIGQAFAAGYHAALYSGLKEDLVLRLEMMDSAMRGFGYEGAAMGLGVMDRVTPWRHDRWRQFLEGPGEPHTYMLYVCLGWVMARFPCNVEKVLDGLDPLLRWLVLDGFGFHEGFFRWRHYLALRAAPRRVRGYGLRAFDQGLGRSLWFVDGANVSRLRETMQLFPHARRSDLWSGVGLAAVYAGEASERDLMLLAHGAGAFAPELAQGAAFAAKARHRARNVSPYTDRAAWALCGMSSADAAAVTDAALENLPLHGPEPAYEVWRRRIQQRFAHGKELKQ